MAWIETVSPRRATGLLKRVYDAALQRAGRIYQIIRLQSLRPKALHASTQLYRELMHAPGGGLTRPQREMIATAVSRANGCHY